MPHPNATTLPGRASLLFVDDEERVVNLLRMIFRDEYTVHTATSGQEALGLIARHPVDVIVSDQRMPGMLGIELLEQVRQRAPSTMRILLTGYSDLAAIVGSVNEGEVFRFINKPWDHDQIKQTIADAVEAGRAAVADAATPPGLAAAMAGATLPDVLVIDDNERDLQAMCQVLGQEHRVRSASSIAEALKVLEQHDIGVIVTEARVGHSDAGDFLRVLKQHYPLITTVMLTRSADADLVIRLINRAQIFRFATKPLRKSVFQLSVSAAMKEHLRFKENPTLARRHRVARSVEPEDATLVAAVTKSLGGLRARFASWVGFTR